MHTKDMGLLRLLCFKVRNVQVMQTSYSCIADLNELHSFYFTPLSCKSLEMYAQTELLSTYILVDTEVV